MAKWLKNSPANTGDMGSIPGSGRSPGEGNGNLLQYSCLENPMDRGAWRATVHGVTRVGHDLETEPPPPPLFAYLFVSLMSVSLSELGNLNVLFSLP